MFNKLKKIVCIIVVLSAAVGVVSFVKELIEEKKKQKFEFVLFSKGFYEKYMKRAFDAFFSTGALIVFSPLIMLISLLVRLKLGSPVIFTQERPGKIDITTGKEKIFKLYKFRTMTDEKDENGKLLPDDMRLTKFGKWLRSTSLDELPELINIIKGDMAVVGPRPLLVEYLPYYSENERHRHDVRPGLTGLAQVNGRNATSWDRKFNWDLKYVNNITAINDIKILFTTVMKVIRKSDILVGKQIEAGRLDDARKL